MYVRERNRIMNIIFGKRDNNTEFFPPHPFISKRNAINANIITFFYGLQILNPYLWRRNAMTDNINSIEVVIISSQKEFKSSDLARSTCK